MTRLRRGQGPTGAPLTDRPTSEPAAVGGTTLGSGSGFGDGAPGGGLGRSATVPPPRNIVDDTAPRAAPEQLRALQADLAGLHGVRIATVIGRYYAMDRDKRWERIKIAVDGLVKGEGEKADDVVAAIEERYTKDETDEFLKPIILSDEGRIKGMRNYL